MPPKEPSLVNHRGATARGSYLLPASVMLWQAVGRCVLNGKTACHTVKQHVQEREPIRHLELLAPLYDDVSGRVVGRTRPGHGSGCGPCAQRSARRRAPSCSSTYTGQRQDTVHLICRVAIKIGAPHTQPNVRNTVRKYASTARGVGGI